MLELFPSVQLLCGSALFAVGGWFWGAIIWVLVGKIRSLSRKMESRPYSAGQGKAPFVRSTGREPPARREAERGRLVLVGRASSVLSAGWTRQMANDRFVSDIK